MTPQPDLANWILPNGALDLATAPECWERNAHFERYEFACAATKGMRVLDFGCGAGYGSAMLARQCAHVTGVDPDEFALELARERHCNYRNLVFTERMWDFDPFDACVAFEVIEHLGDPEGFVATVPSRNLIASVPVVPTRQTNRFHKRDFTIESFLTLVERRFVIRSKWIQVMPFHWEPSIAIVHGELKGEFTR